MKKEIINPPKPSLTPRTPIIGKSLFDKNPELITEWDYEKNYPLTPQNVSYGTTYKAYWKCDKNHSYSMQVNNRTSSQKSGCPYCSPSGNRIWDGNCLATVCPDITKEWNYSRNKQLTPHGVTYASPKHVWWKCQNGHEWICSIFSRTLSKIKNNNWGSCPYCSGKRACKDNCLASLSPQLAKEWNYSKNSLTPEKVTLYSGKKVWWICNKGHEWITSIDHRSIGGTGCPHCSKVILMDGTECDSITEAYFYLKFQSEGKNFFYQKRYDSSKKIIFDFYFPEENKYVEVTGYGPRWARVWGNYLENIKKKEDYVKNVLRAKFEFIQKKLDIKEIQYVRSNMA